LYCCTELLAMGGHLALQSGVSGNKFVGCDSIVVSGG
jgi:hypothetical protein